VGSNAKVAADRARSVLPRLNKTRSKRSAALNWHRPDQQNTHGRAEELKGILDAAVADYTKALELKKADEYVHEKARARLAGAH